MSYCSKCGKEVPEEAEICVHCGCRIREESILTTNDIRNIARFAFILCLGFIGSYIVNHTSLKPKGWKSRTCALFFLGTLTFGIYSLVVAFSQFKFDENAPSNVGYVKD